MKHKVQLLADRFNTIISVWENVECISLNEAALGDTLDPYFAVIFDVFYRDSIPNPEERCKMFGNDISAFETSHQGTKDRFLVGNKPIRMEYKSIEKIDTLVTIVDKKLESLWFIKDSGTYSYYRLAHGTILFSRTGWIDTIRQRLSVLGDDFWLQMRQIYQSKMEHLLNDLGAAFFQQDDFNYLISASLFIKTACLTLFCINRRFEPAHRAYYKQALSLPILPPAFRTHLDTFIRFDAEITRERQYSLAQLIAKDIVAL